jgi:hypothetical protein
MFSAKRVLLINLGGCKGMHRKLTILTWRANVMDLSEADNSLYPASASCLIQLLTIDYLTVLRIMTERAKGEWEQG